MVPGGSACTKDASRLAAQHMLHPQKDATGGKKGNVIRSWTDVRIAGVKHLFSRNTALLDHGDIRFRMNGVDPGERSGFRLKVEEVFPEGRPEQMLHHRFQPLWPFRMARAGIMLQVFRVVDQSDGIHTSTMRMKRKKLMMWVE